jgi:hypothetical protein
MVLQLHRDVTVPVLMTALIKEMADSDSGGLNCSLTLVQRMFAHKEDEEIHTPSEGDEIQMFSYQVNDQVRVEIPRSHRQETSNPQYAVVVVLLPSHYHVWWYDNRT